MESSPEKVQDKEGEPMESGQIINKDLKVQIPSEATNVSSGGAKFQVMQTSGSPPSMLTRQPSATKGNCLCSPTSHPGSFRCRLHRAPSLQRTKSIDSASLSDPTTNEGQ